MNLYFPCYRLKNNETACFSDADECYAVFRRPKNDNKTCYSGQYTLRKPAYSTILKS